MCFVTVTILLIVLALHIMRQSGLLKLPVKRKKMEIKIGILAIVIPVLLLCACAGAQTGTEAANQTLNNEEKENADNNSEDNTDFSTETRTEYFEEADCLPVPSSLFPETFTFRVCDVEEKFKIYAYSMPTNDMETAKENYRKYLDYLNARGGFGFVDATKELEMNGIYITYGGKCVAVSSLLQSDDETCIEMCILFGDDFDKIFNLYHGDEQSTSSSSPSSGTQELSQGNYSVPGDIPAGKYDIEIGSSEEYAISSVHYYKNGRAKGIYAITGDRGYNGLELEAGDMLEISGDSIILKRR